MKYSVVAIAFAALVNAQTRDDIPSCAIGCLDDAIKSETDCAVNDYPCVCENFDSLQGSATSCVIEKCGAEKALNEVLPAVEALCAAQGDDKPSETSEAPKPTETAEKSSEVVSIPEETASATPTASASASKSNTASNPTATQPAPAPVPTTNGTAPEPSAVPAGAAALGPIGAVAIGALFLAL